MIRRNQIIVGDALAALRGMPSASVDCVVTSPPYFRLRDYGVEGQLGAEASVAGWVDNLRVVAQEIARVLTPTGSLWLNLGDGYSLRPGQGSPRKGLLLGPERLALALITDGWLLRNKIVWHKTNAMPTSVRDRLASTWEPIYVFTRQPRYFFDLDAIRRPHRSHGSKRHRTTALVRGQQPTWQGSNAANRSGLLALKGAGVVGHPLGANPGDVWDLASSNYRGSHRATFPIALAERAIQAGAPESRCIRCRLPWRRNLLRSTDGTAKRTALLTQCDCEAGAEPGIVLDPFIGAGSTAIAAERHGRSWLGIELNPGFASEAVERIRQARAA